MLDMLAQIHYGFYGLHGFLGVIVGLVLCLIIIWGIWSIFDIIATKFSKPETGWMFQIVRIVLIVATVVWFVGTVFGLLP